jgi:hypothetical protein
VDERLGCRCYIAERVNMRHHVVPKASLECCSRIEVDIVQVLSHLIDCFTRNVHSELALRFRK